MFIDYLTLLLVNMAAGLVILAGFFLRGLSSPNPRPWAAPLAMVGAVAFLVGLHMTLTWPITGDLRFANVAFGETSVMLGVLLLGAALVVAKGWDLLPLSIYAVVAGVAAIVLGVTIYLLKLTQSPALATAGFVLSGLAGVAAPVVLLLRKQAKVRALMALVLLAAAGIWAFIGYGAYYMHVEGYTKGLRAPKPATAPASPGAQAQAGAGAQTTGSQPATPGLTSTQPGGAAGSQPGDLRRKIQDEYNR